MPWSPTRLPGTSMATPWRPWPITSTSTPGPWVESSARPVSPSGHGEDGPTDPPGRPAHPALDQTDIGRHAEPISLPDRARGVGVAVPLPLLCAVRASRSLVARAHWGAGSTGLGGISDFLAGSRNGTGVCGIYSLWSRVGEARRWRWGRGFQTMALGRWVRCLPATTRGWCDGASGGR